MVGEVVFWMIGAADRMVSWTMHRGPVDCQHGAAAMAHIAYLVTSSHWAAAYMNRK